MQAASQLARELRIAKLNPACTQVPATLEICLVAPTDTGSQFPGLYLFVGGSRLLRPVKSLVRVGPESINEAETEMIGTFEQPYMDIAVTLDELMERPVSERRHFEISPEAIFSFTASLTPYPDFNQSPRNMYQCQMAKQTMGHSTYTWKHRADPKAYRLLTPQSPLVRTKSYVKYDVDHYPLGFNAVVAVMSYTVRLSYYLESGTRASVNCNSIVLSPKTLLIATRALPRFSLVSKNRESNKAYSTDPHMCQ